MNIKTDEIQSIIECLEQKKLLITETLNITKQIEVQSKQEDVDVEELVDKRQILIDRMKKCDVLINKNIDALDSDSRDQWQKIIKHMDAQISNDREIKAQNLLKDILELNKRTLALDKVANKNINTAYIEAKEELIKVRRKNKTDTLFK